MEVRIIQKQKKKIRFIKQKVSYKKTRYLINRGRMKERNRVLYRCPKTHYYYLPTYYLFNFELYCPCCDSTIVEKDSIYSTFYLRDLAKKNNGEFMTGGYVNKDFEYIWQCMAGHIFTRTVEQVEHGDWCLICRIIGGYIRSTKKILYGYEEIIKYYDLIRERSEEFYENKIDLNEKLDITCKKGHIWNDRIWNIFILNGKCPYCNKNIGFYNIEYARKLAKKNKCVCLSKECKDSITPLLWRCRNGHKWKDSIYAVETQNRWCVECKKSDII